MLSSVGFEDCASGLIDCELELVADILAEDASACRLCGCVASLAKRLDRVESESCSNPSCKSTRRSNGRWLADNGGWWTDLVRTK